VDSAEGYLLNNFFFAPASSLSLASPTSGYSKSRSARASITAAATTADVSGLQAQIASPIEISIPSRASTALGNRS